MKTQQEIAATTRAQGKIPRPADYQPHAKLTEWDASLSNVSTLTRDQFIRRVEPMHDRILVRLLNEPRTGSIVLTDAKPLIGGCRKAVVLKTGPGRWIPGEWWKTTVSGVRDWFWHEGYRRPVAVQPWQIVLIGNWVDLEIEDIALCQEGDVRVAWPN